MMYSFSRRRTQGGVTLVETLAVVAISSIIMIPLLGWGLLAIQEQEAVFDRNTDGASIGLLRTYFVRDVASASDAKIGTYAEDTDCPGGAGAGTGSETLLRLGGDDDEYVVYNEVASSRGVGLSIWRRECDGTTLKASAEVVDRVASGATTVTCTARDGAPVAEDDCGRVSFRLTTEDAETVAMTALVRAGKTVVSVPSGPVYVSPLVSIQVSPTTVFRGDVVNFDASASSDPRGGTLSHHWDFGDGTTSTDAVATHSYTALGEFTAVYTATNSDGTPASDYVRVTVNNRPPTAVISQPTGPVSTTRCADVTFAAAGSNDSPDAPYGGSVDIYQWTYGDGASSGLTSPAAHTHQFGSLGAFTPSLVVIDNDGGGSLAATASVAVENRPPTMPTIAADGGTGPITGIVSKEVAFTSSVSDPDLCASSDETLTYDWDFGDGGSSSDPNPNHIYTTGGLYTAELTVTDTGGVTVTSNTITVDLNTSPVASFTMSPSTIRAGQALPAGWITNNSSDPDGNPMTAAWNFPYGTPGSSTAWTPPSVTFNHNVGGGDTFVSANYTVGLTVTDSRGAPHSQNKTITVTGAPYPGNFRQTGSGRYCTNSSWIGCLDWDRYIDFAWNAVPNVNLYQIDLDCDDWLIPCGDYLRTFAGPTARFDGLDYNILGTLDYDARIRSRDSVTGKWGAWSPWINVNSG